MERLWRRTELQQRERQRSRTNCRELEQKLKIATSLLGLSEVVNLIESGEIKIKIKSTIKSKMASEIHIFRSDSVHKHVCSHCFY